MTLRGRDIEYGGPVVRWEDIKRGRESKEAVLDLRFVSGKIRNLVILIVVAR